MLQMKGYLILFKEKGSNMENQQDIVRDYDDPKYLYVELKKIGVGSFFMLNSSVCLKTSPLDFVMAFPQKGMVKDFRIGKGSYDDDTKVMACNVQFSYITKKEWEERKESENDAGEDRPEDSADS